MHTVIRDTGATRRTPRRAPQRRMIRRPGMGGPDDDPYAPDAEVLARSRARILALEPVLIVPGHGSPFAPQ